MIENLLGNPSPGTFISRTVVVSKSASQGVVLRSRLAGASAPGRALRQTVEATERAHGRQTIDRELDVIIEACVRRLRAKQVPVAG